MSTQVVYPSYGADSLLGVLPRAAKHLQTGQVRAVVVVLCDGLGYENLVVGKAHAPYLRRRLPEVEPCTTTFPSTTAAAIVAFGTGECPGRTGFVGYTARDPLTGALVNLVSWTQQSDPLVVGSALGNSTAPPYSVNAGVFQPLPSQLLPLSQSGVKVTSVGPAKFAGSALSVAAFGSPNYAVAEKLSDRVQVTLRLLSTTTQPQLIYLYSGELDKAGHEFGPHSMQWDQKLTDFDAEFARLVRRAPAGTLVVLTADHGQVGVDLGRQVDVAKVPVLTQDVALVAGEARAAHVYLKSGAEVADVADRWRNYLGSQALVWTRAEAVAQGLFGAVEPRVFPWLGDLVVAALGSATVVDSRTQTSNSLVLPGVHGSLTSTEMLVPYLETYR